VHADAALAPAFAAVLVLLALSGLLNFWAVVPIAPVAYILGVRYIVVKGEACLLRPLLGLRLSLWGF
jgi:hypothetical protein